MGVGVVGPSPEIVGDQLATVAGRPIGPLTGDPERRRVPPGTGDGDSGGGGSMPGSYSGFARGAGRGYRSPPMPHRFASALALLLTCLALTGCAWLARRQAIKRCEFQLGRVEPVDVSLLDPSVDLLIEVDVRNPNPIEALLEPFTWQLLVGEREVARGRREDSIAIASASHTSFTMEVAVSLWEGGKSILAAIVEGQATYRLPALVYLSTPFGDIEYEVTIEEGRWTSTDGLERFRAE